MDPERNVAIVGRPNVGKSRLFNRLVGRRVAIVHDMPGVTRDLSMAEVGEDYLLVDTGGIGMKPEMTPEAIHAATEEQVDLALASARVILLVVEGPTGTTAIDEDLAEKLRPIGKKVLLVVNKIDRARDTVPLREFYALGFGEPLLVSAEHGTGAEELHRAILDALGPKPKAAPEPEDEARIKICLCGRPNVGKSSLGNRLLNAPRMIVSDIAGTTRDAVETELDWTDRNQTAHRFTLIDTAGVKPGRKLGSSLDYFSNLRSEAAVEKADVAFLVLDAREGVRKHDKKFAGDILEAGCGLVIVVNKWDYARELFRTDPPPGYKNEKAFRQAFVQAAREELFFLPDSPVIFTSATEGYQVEDILAQAVSVYATAQMQIPTGKLNACLRELLEARPPRVVGGKRFKVYYAVQLGNRPFRFRLYCNKREKLEDSYERYLQAGFQEYFRLEGCPIRFELWGKPGENPYYEPLRDPRSVNTLSKHRGGAAKNTGKRRAARPANRQARKGAKKRR